MLNNQTRSVYDCVKSLFQRAIKEISLKLREVSISMSKFSVSLLQWYLSSMQWSSHRSIYQWINSSISSHATSESVSMTSILNAMIYSLSSVNLIIHSHATSESATMISSKSISLMSKLTSESASMTRSSLITSKFMSLFLYWNLNSEFASMILIINAMIYKHIALFISESIYLKFLYQLVSLLQWHVQ